MIIGGSHNYIAAGAVSIQLINCTNVNVNGDVTGFTGIGLSNMTIDNSYNGTVKIGSIVATVPVVASITSDFTIDGKHSIYEINLDTLGADITATWDATAYPIELTFKIVSNTGLYRFNISCGLVTIDGNTSPYNTALNTNDSITVYSNGTNLYII